MMKNKKIPEPSDYPKWLSEILFSAEKGMRCRYGREDHERFAKTLFNLMQVARVDDQANLLFNLCIEHEQMRIEHAVTMAAMRDALAEIEEIKLHVAKIEAGMIPMKKGVTMLLDMHKKKIKKQSREMKND